MEENQTEVRHFSVLSYGYNLLSGTCKVLLLTRYPLMTEDGPDEVHRPSGQGGSCVTIQHRLPLQVRAEVIKTQDNLGYRLSLSKTNKQTNKENRQTNKKLTL